MAPWCHRVGSSCRAHVAVVIRSCHCGQASSGTRLDVAHSASDSSTSGILDRQHLADHAAHREAHEMHLVEPQRIEQTARITPPACRGRRARPAPRYRHVPAYRIARPCSLTGPASADSHMRWLEAREWLITTTGPPSEPLDRVVHLESVRPDFHLIPPGIGSCYCCTLTQL